MAKKGDRVILPCEFKARDIFHIRLNRQSKHILVHQIKYCSKRVCRQGACDIIIKDLRLRDAGKYFLEIYYIHAKSVLDPQIKTYQLHIYGKVKSDQIICMFSRIPLVIVWFCMQPAETLNGTSLIFRSVIFKYEFSSDLSK